MSNLTDETILRAIWHKILKRLPLGVTHNYFGDGKHVGLCGNTKDYLRWSTEFSTRDRQRLGLPIGDVRSMVRIKKLISAGLLESERQEPGRSFWFWFPENISKPAFERCLCLMREAGMPEKPATISNYDEIVAKVREQLLVEFGDVILVQERLE